MIIIELSLDGDSWIALVGTDLQAGISGVGYTIKEALIDLANKIEEKHI